jgi:MoxR-like ATPase
MSIREQILTLRERMAQAIIGQSQVIERILLTLLCNGNLLLERLPSLAKTRAIKSLAANLDAEFRRIQFTSDLLPSDVTRTMASLLDLRHIRRFEVAMPLEDREDINSIFPDAVDNAIRTQQYFSDVVSL